MKDKAIVYSVLFTVIIIVNVLIFTFWRPLKEHFTTEPTNTNAGEKVDVTQEAPPTMPMPSPSPLPTLDETLRTFIIKLFDEKFQRNPTPDEINTYVNMNDRELIQKEIKSMPITTTQTQQEMKADDITFSKVFIKNKIDNIQMQLDDLKRLL